MSPGKDLYCGTGQRFPQHSPELWLTGIKPCHVSWSFPTCRTSSQEKNEQFQAFLKQLEARELPSRSFRLAFGKEGGRNAGAVRVGSGLRSPQPPQDSLCIFHAHMVGLDPI